MRDGFFRKWLYGLHSSDWIICFPKAEKSLKYHEIVVEEKAWRDYDALE